MNSPTRSSSDSEIETDDNRSRTSSNTNLTSFTELTSPSHSPKLYEHIQAQSSYLKNSKNKFKPNYHHGFGWKLGQAQSKSNYYANQPLFNQSLNSNQIYLLNPERSFDDPQFTPITSNHQLSHSEFGSINIDQIQYMWESKYRPNDHFHDYPNEDAGVLTYLTAYWSYLIVFLIGHLRDFFGKRFSPNSYAHLMPHDGYAALNSDFGSFFTRRVKSRLDDCFSRPVSGSPARTITLLDRTTEDNGMSFKYTHSTTQALNISSYNYLGFAQSSGICTDSVEETINSIGISSAGSRDDIGVNSITIQAEKLIATFLGTEDSLLISQGFATNSTTFPALVGKGSLVISDELNHSSIRFGTRLSGAMVRTYKHNDMKDLERLLRETISEGQPRKMRAWKKILVVVEGIYSMEGSIVDLPNLLRLKEKYQFYLYLDEAHSIGALGPRGRGVCDYFGIEPSRIDILMGTLTKSFGASGGYIAGNRATIQHLRKTCHSSIYAETLSPAVTSQIISSLTSIMGSRTNRLPTCLSQLTRNRIIENVFEGELRLRRLAFNSRYLHVGLRKLGFIVGGDHDSPIVPLLIFQPGKMLLFSRLMLQRYQIVVVIVGYPATPLVSGRVRFCVSGSHTKEDLDKILIATDEIGNALGLKLGKVQSRMKVEEIIENALELVSGTYHK
ncbi:pyridoxal phosphate-dependent transferase [Melampsora americana]|nr:pyridoxal phosphate-dependent transferase [Melampsora americana]